MSVCLQGMPGQRRIRATGFKGRALPCPHTHRAEVKEPGASSGVRRSPLYTCSGLCDQRALTSPSWML